MAKAAEIFSLCDDQWFRPVDFKLGPDGAMYIADFYNRIIGHYEVPLTTPAATTSMAGFGGSSIAAPTAGERFRRRCTPIGRRKT